MKRGFARCPVLAVFALWPFVSAYAGTIHGTVRNGTTGKTAAGIEVVLIQLQGGMQDVLNSKTDANGQFTFDHPSLGVQPMLIRAAYKGVNFHQPVPRGSTNVEVEVFDPSRDPKTVEISTHVVIFQPDGPKLIVGEEYTIRNNSQPPQAYFRPDGNFDFTLPEKAELKQVAAQGPSGMPVVQAPMDRGKNRYSIAFAFRPGDNGVRYSYELPYPRNTATVRLPTVYPGVRLFVVAPPSVQVTGEGLQAGGQEQGMSIYVRNNTPANAMAVINLSGTAPPPSSNDTASDPGSQGQDTPQGEAAAGATIQQVPGRLDDLKWPLLAAFIGIFALLAILLARKPVATVVGTAPAATTGVTSKAGAKTASGPSNASSSRPAGLADVDATVATSLDALKDTLFRLELRHQAGTISEEEYKQERARAEKVLRDLLRG